MSTLNEISKSIGQYKGLFTYDVSDQRGVFPNFRFWLIASIAPNAQIAPIALIAPNAPILGNFGPFWGYLGVFLVVLGIAQKCTDILIHLIKDID